MLNIFILNLILLVTNAKIKAFWFLCNPLRCLNCHCSFSYEEYLAGGVDMYKEQDCNQNHIYICCALCWGSSANGETWADVPGGIYCHSWCLEKYGPPMYI